ncbi:hypothetical protein glysoja_030694 [Glycine soja]|uniref:Uncharacterized protein n=1 Tax=Glycine soja TaxID=3848 RepID=A0A0B2QSD2_GLYSO|nr:hypothetical protein glysoja_030694 [Glycine soja]
MDKSLKLGVCFSVRLKKIQMQRSIYIYLAGVAMIAQTVLAFRIIFTHVNTARSYSSVLD